MVYIEKYACDVCGKEMLKHPAVFVSVFTLRGLSRDLCATCGQIMLDILDVMEKIHNKPK